MTDIPHDHLGQPDLQALVRQCGGFDKISLELWTAVGSPNGRSAVVPDSMCGSRASSCWNSLTSNPEWGRVDEPP
jgi:hypothetical protein